MPVWTHSALANVHVWLCVVGLSDLTVIQCVWLCDCVTVPVLRDPARRVAKVS
jgi:hypothetical protein